MRRLNFDNSYFDHRQLNDPRRLKSFELEAQIIKKYVKMNETVCDIGCSTGEFLKYLGWEGKRYGIEISPFASSQASKEGIVIVENIETIQDALQCVILRGTLQHLPDPFGVLAKIYDALTPGGFLFVLATPNIDSIYFRIFRDLPAFDYPLNYWLTGYRNIKLVCEREGFIFSEVSFPYLRSGYAHPFDLPKFILRLVFRDKRLGSAFPGNMMNIVFQKQNRSQ